jgi:hypothetical protein
VTAERSTTGEALRRFTLGSGPLKRTSDRAQFLARVLLVCTLAAAVPVALVVASLAHAQAVTEVAAQSLERHQVDAELLADPTVITRGSDDIPPSSRAPVVWSGPAGGERTGDAAVSLSARAGSTVRIWVDQDGDLTSRPLDAADAVAQAVAAGAVVYLWTSTSAAAVYLAFRASLDRRRLRRWAAEWAAVEPEWTRRVP